MLCCFMIIAVTFFSLANRRGELWRRCCWFKNWSWELRAPCATLWLNSKTNRPTNRNMFFIILTHNFLFNYSILLQIFLLYFLNLKVAINALANWKIRAEIHNRNMSIFVRWFFVEFDQGEALLSLSSDGYKMVSIKIEEYKNDQCYVRKQYGYTYIGVYCFHFFSACFPIHGTVIDGIDSWYQ